MKKKTIIVIIALIVVLLLCLLPKDAMIHTYVLVCQDTLEGYAQQMLEDNANRTGTYGTWETRSYPEEGMVEFWTGGSGLAPNSVYKGFYYSADNTHKPFSIAGDVALEIDGDRARWTDGSDNRGVSIRIAENWFWYEAAF